MINKQPFLRDFDLYNEYSRITYAKEVADYFFNKYRQTMLNSNINLYYEMSTETGMEAIGGMQCDGMIIIRLGILDQAGMYMIATIPPMEYSKYQELYCMGVAFTVLHEMGHGTTVIDGYLMNTDINYIDMQEGTANSFALDVLKLEGFDENLFGILIGNQYRRPLLQTETQPYSLKDFYEAALIYNPLFAMFDIFNDPKSTKVELFLQTAKTIILDMIINNNNIPTTIIKHDWSYLPPTPILSSLLSYAIIGELSNSSIEITNDSNDEDVYMIKIICTIRVSPLYRENVEDYYGVSRGYKNTGYY